MHTASLFIDVNVNIFVMVANVECNGQSNIDYIYAPKIHTLFFGSICTQCTALIDKYKLKPM